MAESAENPKSVLREEFEWDVSKLSSEQVDELRKKLKEYIAQGDVTASFGEMDVLLSHSSHKDTDGFI
jgi:hypothetical protein